MRSGAVFCSVGNVISPKDLRKGSEVMTEDVIVMRNFCSTTCKRNQ